MNGAAGDPNAVLFTPQRGSTRINPRKGLLSRIRRWFFRDTIKTIDFEKHGIDYETTYNLSPPKTLGCRSLKDALHAIKEDWGNKIEIKVVKGGQGKTLKWKKDGKDLPEFNARALLFLYGRVFYHEDKFKGERWYSAIETLTEDKESKPIMLQIMAFDGDKDRSSDEDYKMHYIRGCKTTFRYFLRNNAKGFLKDMTNLNYYLRIQKAGGCFLRAPALIYSYIHAFHGQQVPPLDVSRLIRHQFTNKELVKYVKDEGGDSSYILERIAERMFGSKGTISSTNCEDEMFCKDPNELVRRLIDELLWGPVLVSKFTIKGDRFDCHPPSQSLLKKLPDLADYDDWDDVPANKIPPGVARFTKWGELGEFILLDCPSNKKSEEDELNKKWNGRLNTDVSTRGCGSSGDPEGIETILIEKECGAARHKPLSVSQNESFKHLSTMSTESGTTSQKTLYTSDSMIYLDDPSKEFYGTPTNVRTGGGQRGTDDYKHAMILVGYLEENGSYYWQFQNSWGGHMQLIEVSTKYLLESGAHLHRVTVPRDVKPAEWRDGSHFHCSSPVAESIPVCRRDDRNWSDLKGLFPSPWR